MSNKVLSKDIIIYIFINRYFKDDPILLSSLRLTCKKWAEWIDMMYIHNAWKLLKSKGLADYCNKCLKIALRTDLMSKGNVKHKLSNKQAICKYKKQQCFSELSYDMIKEVDWKGLLQNVYVCKNCYHSIETYMIQQARKDCSCY